METIVGTAGHIDHGKTALVKALTGIDADRLPEEKLRGITVDLGFAEMSVGDVHFGFVDVPGHEKFVRNMLAGASGIDIVLLVVAADEGVMPQTREHFDICRLLDIRSGVIALTKSDLVDAETLDLAKLDITELVADSFLENVPVIAVSSKTGAGVDELKGALQNSANRLPEAGDPHIARLPLDRSFTIKGFGTVVTGTLHSGQVDAAVQLELLPERRAVRVRGLQTHGSSTDAANPGQRVAVNIANIAHDEIERGMMLAETGVLAPTQIIDAEIELLKGAPRPLRSRARVRVHVGTAEILARVQVLNESGEIAQGSRDFAQIRLETPTAAIPGERFIIRSYSPQVTIAGGIVLHNSAERHRRREFASIRDDLAAIREALDDPAKIVFLLVANSRDHGIKIGQLQARTGYRQEVVVEALAKSRDIVVDAGGHYVDRSAFAAIKKLATDSLNEAHRRDPLSKGVSREALAQNAFAFLPQAVIDSTIDSLQREGVIVVDGEIVRFASYEATLSPDEQNFTDKLVALYRGARLDVSKLNEATTQAADGLKLTTQTIAKLVRLAVDDGRIIKVTDEFYFDAEAIDDLKKLLREKVDVDLDVPSFKNIAGVSRKYAIPLLEYFDRTHVTARVGDKRVVIK